MHHTKLAIVVALLYIFPPCKPILANLNDVIHSWLLRPLDIDSVQRNGQSEQFDIKLQQTLEGFINQQSLKHFTNSTNSTKDDLQKGLVAGVVTAACKLVDLTGSAFGAELSNLEELVNNIPRYLDKWPLIRRVLVAALALHHQKHGPLTLQAHEGAVHTILVNLFTQHKESAQWKGAMEFMHVSKSGGSSFCRLAKDNGCRSQNFYRKNCLIMDFNDGLAGGVKTRCTKGLKTITYRSKELTCHDRRIRLQKKGFTMYANEYTALGGRMDPALAHACPNMLTVLEIRHPYSRTLSHIKHAWEWYRIYCGTDRENVYFAKPGHNTTRWWTALMPAPTNNYLVRSLLGEKIFRLPQGGITQDHLTLAMNFLAEQYDVVLVLEDQLQFKEGMLYGLGWDVHERHVNSNSERKSVGGEPVPEDLGALWELNQLDVELYRFGVLMARLDAIMYGTVAAGASKPKAPASTAAVAFTTSLASAVTSPGDGVAANLTGRLAGEPGRTEGGSVGGGRAARRLEGLMEATMMAVRRPHFSRLPLFGSSRQPPVEGHCGWVGEKEQQQQRQGRFM